MNVRFGCLLLGLVASLAVPVACTGSDPDITPVDDAGVEAAVEDTAAPVDAGASDADSRPPHPECIYEDTASDAGFVCPSMTGQQVCTKLCCLRTAISSSPDGCFDDAGDCAPDLRHHECDHPGMCTTGGACCLLTYSDYDIEQAREYCPSQVTFSDMKQTQCIGGDQCPPGGYAMCRTNADCKTGKCRRFETTASGGTIFYGLCLEN